MLLRRIKDYRMRLALGQLFSICGIIGLIAAGVFGGNGFFGLFLDESRLLDFLRGFLAGVSGVLLGLSVVFNIAALLTIRKETSA
jgi:hypothetical protein